LTTVGAKGVKSNFPKFQNFYEYNFPIFENDAKLDFPYDFTFLQSLLVEYLKTMNMDLTPFARLSP
jgi:hypothetical protein